MHLVGFTVESYWCALDDFDAICVNDNNELLVL